MSVVTYINKQGDTFSSPLHESVAIIHGSRTVELQDHSYSCCRGPESESRSFVQIQDPGNGMDVESISGGSNLSLFGKTTDRSVCIRSKSCSPNFLFLAAEPEGVSDRRIQSELDGDVRLRISFNLPNSSDFIAVGCAGMHFDSSCSLVGPGGHVYTDSQFVGGFPIDSACQDRSVETTTGMFYHHNPSLFKLVAWKISSQRPLVETLQTELKNWWVSRCGWVPGEIMQQNTGDTIVGVWNGVLIPAQCL